VGRSSGHSPRRRPTSIVVGICAAAALAAGFVVLEPSRVTGAVGDVGLEGPSYSGAGAEPPGSKPESKLWWHDGFWWGSLWDAVTGDHHIFRLDPASQEWNDTGVVIDSRSNTRSDVLSDGRKLYVASHVFSTRSSSGYPARLFRFSYDRAAKTYSLDPGFPATINNYGTETLVIDKDSTGRLWATWVRGRSVYVSHTLANDRSWASPFVLPANGARSVRSDDISSLVAFGGSKVGVMWSNQSRGSLSFAVHLDGQPPSSWRPVEVALGGPRGADDHINLKADRDGRVFAAVRTRRTSSTAAQVLLLARTPTGTWSRHTFGTVTDRHGRAILLLDEDNRRAHVFATSAENNGTVYAKDAPLGAPVFEAGLGTPFLRSFASATMNNPTSTKQSVSGETGAVVVGGLTSTSRYWHNTLRLPATEEPAVKADLVAAPTSGFAPLIVSFSDRSSDGVTGRTWNFGDGSPVSTEANPVHTYAAAGSYTVTLTVWDETGAEAARTRVAYVTVLPLAAGFSVSQTSGRVPLFVSFADESSGPITGRLWDLGDGTTSTRTNPVHVYRRAGLYTVRLTVTDDAGNSTTSTKTAYVNALPLTAEFTGAPTLGPAPLTVLFSDGTLGKPTEWSWDFGDGGTSAARSPIHAYAEPGTYPVSLTVKDSAGNTSTRTRSAYVTARPLTADFSGTPTLGPAPLAVAFTDTSSGRSTSWVWDFGDGTPTSDKPKPTHTYRRPGAYTVTLTVGSGDGDAGSKTKTSYVTATSDLVVKPAADAYVRSSSSSANTNFGAATTIRVRHGGSSEHQRSYLAFDVPTLPGTLVAAKLRLFVTNSSTLGGDVYAVASPWTETGISWANAPAITGSPLGTIGSSPTNTWVETALPLGAFAPGPGRYAFALSQAAAASDVYFSSREASGRKQPQLVLTVDYGPKNAPPDALDDGASTDEDAPVVVDVLANDDPGLPEETDQSVALDAITTAPAHGTASIEAGRISYVPHRDYNGLDSLVYRVCDSGAQPLCSSARLGVFVLSVNDAPRAADDAVAGNEDVAHVLGLLANDAAGPANEAEQTLRVEAVTAPPQHGHAEILAGKVVYTAAPHFNGTDTLAYRACDDGVPRLCTEAAVAVSLASVNDAPRAAADTAVTDEDLTSLVAVLANDAPGPPDEMGQGLRIDRIVTQPAYGTASVEQDGVRYAPGLDYHGLDSFTYRVCDDGDPSLCTTGVVDIDVLSVNDLPAAHDDKAVADEDSLVSIEVLANDRPGESEQTMKLEHLVSPPSHGTAEIVLGRVLYTPSPDYNGPDVLAYRACDDGRPRLCLEATVAVTVIAVNDPPRPDPDTAVAEEDLVAMIPVLANDDSGPADEAVQGLLIDGVVAPPKHGTASVGRGWVRYTPAPNYGGADKFTYRLCDGGDPLLCATGRVDIEVVRANDAPGARDDTAIGIEKAPISIDVLANDDAGPGEKGQRIRLAGIAWAPAHGAAFVAGGRVVYMPAPEYQGSDILAYRVCDDGPSEMCSIATVAVQLVRRGPAIPD
jgi:PKD repeat protein